MHAGVYTKWACMCMLSEQRQHRVKASAWRTRTDFGGSCALITQSLVHRSDAKRSGDLGPATSKAFNCSPEMLWALLRMSLPDSEDWQMLSLTE